MERLTTEIREEKDMFGSGYCFPSENSRNHWFRIYNMLASYENTNLTPAEIEALKSKLQKVEREMDAAIQDLRVYCGCETCNQHCGGCAMKLDVPVECIHGWQWRGLEDTACE